jgi:hypothetical protein
MPHVVTVLYIPRTYGSLGGKTNERLREARRSVIQSHPTYSNGAGCTDCTDLTVQAHPGSHHDPIPAVAPTLSTLSTSAGASQADRRTLPAPPSALISPSVCCHRCLKPLLGALGSGRTAVHAVHHSGRQAILECQSWMLDKPPRLPKCCPAISRAPGVLHRALRATAAIRGRPSRERRIDLLF